MTTSPLKDSFKNSLLKQYLSSTDAGLTEKEVNDFANYLLDFNIIPKVTMQIYTVIAGFDKIAKQHPKKSKSECVNLLTAQLQLKESTITNILKDHKGRFGFF